MALAREGVGRATAPDPRASDCPRRRPGERKEERKRLVRLNSCRADDSLRQPYEKSMKAVILAGGLGTRLSEETHIKPKPMVEIGGKPILWHVLKIYSHFNIHEFIICCGYKGYLIKEYFANYFLHTSDVTFHMDVDNHMEVHHRKSEPWKVTLVDTGEQSQTAGRLGRVRSHLNEESFCFTYGDGLANVDIHQLLTHHRRVGTQATLTAVQPPGRYGALHLEGHAVR